MGFDLGSVESRAPKPSRAGEGGLAQSAVTWMDKNDGLQSAPGPFGYKMTPAAAGWSQGVRGPTQLVKEPQE